MSEEKSEDSVPNGKFPDCGDTGYVYNLPWTDGTWWSDPEDYKSRCPKCYPSKCFIATEVYGNPDAPEVEKLRDFRDKILRRSKLGKKIIELYYGGLGEGLAQIVGDFPFSKPAIKKGLDYIARRHNKLRDRS